MKDVTILVNSCDLYEDAWEPFFRLLHIQWSDCGYEIVLNSETKEYSCDFFNIKTHCAGLNKSWSQRVLECLNEIESEYVLFFLEDQFLREPVNVDWFNKTVDYMRANDDVGVIFLRQTGKQKVAFVEDFFPRDRVTDTFRIVGLTALYRKDYFKKILRAHENPWEYERYASIRSKRYNDQVLQYNKDNPPIFVFDDKIEKGYGITSRKWLPRNKELFDRYNIEVNFDNLGWYDIEAKEKSLSNEKTRPSNSLVETLYNAKKKVIIFRRYFFTLARKWKSLK